jgi:hypothetical protein
MLVPTLLAGLAVVRFRSYAGMATALAGFIVVGGPWLVSHGASVLAYVASSSDPMRTISDSPAMTWAARFSPDNLLYYPTVLRDALGWPGLVLCAFSFFAAWMKPAGRWAALVVLGGALVLTFAGENQARYIFPALPMLAVLIDIGLRPGFRDSTARIAVIGGVCATIPALWGSVTDNLSGEPIPPVRDRSHPVESLATWGEWPWPMEAFRPVSNPLGEWAVDDAIDAIASSVGPGSQQIGLLLPRDARMPFSATYSWRAGRRGKIWDVATIASGGPQGRPMVFVGPTRTRGAEQSRRFKIAYAVHPKGFPPPLLTGIDGEVIWRNDLPHGFQGSVFTIPDHGWSTPVGQLLQKDPLDG